ncbi:MAG: phosphoenolpyruvate--protein phosphotransferase [Spirochaetales bacterium]|nr:phosphoenolpyruvate--protein phosphotransferase [Spirochaetales bacterium]
MEVIIPGFSMGKPLYISAGSNVIYNKIDESQRDAEKGRIKAGLNNLNQKLSHEMESCCDKETNELLSSFIEILEDDSIQDSLFASIDSLLSAPEAVRTEGKKQYSEFLQLEIPYLKERAGDILDLFQQLECIVDGRDLAIDLTEPSILIVNELTPMMLLSMNNMENLKGVLSVQGSPTSHTTLILKSYEVPYAVGFEDLSAFKSNQNIIVDLREKTSQKIQINPTMEERVQAQNVLNQLEEEKAALQKFQSFSIKRESQGKLQLKINGASSAESELAFSRGADGIGLVRSEFIFMNEKQEPSEDVQFSYYKDIIEAQKGNPVTIRTLDVGGDKGIDYLGMPQEENPFLGFRAIRYCLKNQDLFRRQIRAILRASAFGNVRILIPFVTTVDELKKSKQLIKEEHLNLQEHRIACAQKIPVGCMIETAASIFIIDELTDVADFISIGTNDLIQYVMAADRGNAQVAKYYDWNHPAVLQALNFVMKSARKKNIETSICGDLAGHTDLIPKFLEWGVSSLSVSLGNLLKVKKNLMENYFQSIHG